MDIKPPQAARGLNRKKSSIKDKKHSRDRRHKERDHDRERMMREREKERMEERRHRHSSSINRERERHFYRREHHEREHEYHARHKDREREKRLERNIRERDRQKSLEQQYESKSDAERALEDLRSRLLSKRHRREEKEIARYDDGDPYESVSRAMISDQKKEHKERRENIIELIDSPEHYSDYTSHRRREKKLIHEDPEQAARRAKLLEAEREMLRRKELAREELEARRELQRERGDFVLSPVRKTKSKRHQITMDGTEDHRKRLKKSPKEDGEYIEKSIVDVSDNTDESTDNDEDNESDSESDSGSHSNASRKDVHSAEEDEVPPGSPLSVGDLTKSDHRRRSQSRSRSRSVESHSGSHSDGSKSNHSRSRSKSRSRSHSRSDRSATKSRSRSRSPSQSHSRSLSRSRSRSPLNNEKTTKLDIRDDAEDDDIEMKDNQSEAKKAEEEKETIQKEDDSPRDEKGEKLPNYFPGIQGCRSVEEFQCLNRIEEGTYGVVYRAKDKRTNEIVALKRLKMEKEKEGFPITSLREINTLLKGQHPNIVTVREIVVGSNMDKIFIVMDYVEHDLKSLMETMKHKEQSFFPGEVKCLTQQLLRAVAHLHDNWILHRDLKTSNLLLSHKGILKVGDFGLAREYGSPLKAYTSLVVTLWYRAPELLLCAKEYSTPIDMWSVGCIVAEFLQMGPLFPGKSEIDQLNRIFKELGTPNEKIWPGYKDLPAVQSLLSQNSHFTEYPVSNLRRRFFNKTSELGFSLLQGLLTYDPKQRLSADQALKSPYFKELPLPIDPSMFPTWPAKSELGVRKALASSPKPPSGGGQFKQLGRDDITTTTTNKTGFVLSSGLEQRQLAMGPGFNLKF